MDDSSLLEFRTNIDPQQKLHITKNIRKIINICNYKSVDICSRRCIQIQYRIP